MFSTLIGWLVLKGILGPHIYNSPYHILHIYNVVKVHQVQQILITLITGFIRSTLSYLNTPINSVFINSKYNVIYCSQFYKNLTYVSQKKKVEKLLVEEIELHLQWGDRG